MVIDKYLAAEQQALIDMEASIESIQAEITGVEEEHAGEEGLLNDATNDKGGITKTTITAFIKGNKTNADEKEAVVLAKTVLELFIKEASLKKSLKAKEAELDELTLAKYKTLTEAEVRTLVVDDKWIASLEAAIQTEIDAISQRLTGRVKELAERYENTLGELDSQTKTLEDKVNTHLSTMGLVWS